MRRGGRSWFSFRSTVSCALVLMFIGVVCLNIMGFSPPPTQPPPPSSPNTARQTTYTTGATSSSNLQPPVPLDSQSPPSAPKTPISPPLPLPLPGLDVWGDDVNPAPDDLWADPAVRRASPNTPSPPTSRSPPAAAPSSPPSTATAATAASPPTSRSASSIDTSSIASFVESGGTIPVMMVTCNRAGMLRKTLQSLLSVRGMTREALYVIQDGSQADVQHVLDEYQLRYHQKTSATGLRRGRVSDGAGRIAQHYGYALNYMFETVTSAPAIIVVEDDFLFASDFYEFFHFIGPVVERDPTLWLASAWNDNGFAGIATDPSALKRTSYFPGLGWLLPRALFVDELKRKWPRTHWDHWMRQKAQHKGRDIVVPEMPRDYHIGIKGTFMDTNTHNMYFKNIAVNMDASFSWRSEAGKASLSAVPSHAYEAALRAAVSSARTLTTVGEVESFNEGLGVVFYRVDTAPIPRERNPFVPMAEFFGIWHEPVRGARDGVHVLRWRSGSVIFLVNLQVNRALEDLSKSAPIHPGIFKAGRRPVELASAANREDPFVVLAGSEIENPVPISLSSDAARNAALKPM